MHGLRAVNVGGVIAPLLKDVGDERVQLGYSDIDIAFSRVNSTWCWGSENSTRYSTDYSINDAPQILQMLLII